MKKKIIACVLACAMLLMGTGYAYWTDIINLSATATTGNLDVKVTGTAYGGNNFKATGALTDESAYDATGHIPTFKDDSNVAFDITNLYPGHYEIFSATVQNFGTVAAKLGKIDVSLGGEGSLAKDVIGIAITGTSSYTTTTTEPDTETTVTDYGPWYDKWEFDWCNGWHSHRVRDVIGSHTVIVPGATTTETLNGELALHFPTGSTFEINGITFIRLSSLADANISEQVANLLYLSNKSTMEFVIEIGMDPDAKGNYTTGTAVTRNTAHSDSLTQGKTESVILDFVWDQYNEGLN